jgi:hypothetical protein
MELDFGDILSGKETKPANEGVPSKDNKLKPTETRARQQSCMISEVDKDLVRLS